MTTYEPTGGDGPYSRIYVSTLQPDEELLANAREHGDDPDLLLEIVRGLDQALADGDHGLAARRIREVRAYARATAEEARAVAVDEPSAGATS